MRPDDRGQIFVNTPSSHSKTDRETEPESLRVLSIDTSSPVTSICISRGNQPVASLALESGNRRSERLWEQIRFLLHEAALPLDQIGLLAVCTGPGGFTGIRVGMAAAKGLAMALARPIAGVTTLDAVASIAASSAASVLALVKANRDQFYYQVFECKDGVLAPSGEPGLGLADLALGAASAADSLVVAVRASAEDIDRTTEAVRRQFGSGFAGIAPAVDPLAPVIARLAMRSHLAGAAGDPDMVRPCYVQPAEAEIKLALGLVGPGLGGKNKPPTD